MEARSLFSFDFAARGGRRGSSFAQIGAREPSVVYFVRLSAFVLMNESISNFQQGVWS